MAKQIIFFHGGATASDYATDEKLVASLRLQLGAGFEVSYPFLPDTGSADLGRRQQINREIAASPDGVILVGHSLGASMLLACLSEMEITKHYGGIFLIATPFWQGDQDWVEAFKLRPHFGEKLDKNIPLFFYHCLDDPEVAFTHLAAYEREVPWACFREIPTGGHQLDNDLTIVANDILTL